MIFVFLTAIRVDPEHWITWRQHIGGLFAASTEIAGFTCENLDRTELMIEANQPFASAFQNMGQVLASLKAQDIYHRELKPFAEGSDNTAHLVIFRTGEVCRVDLVRMSASEGVSKHSEIRKMIDDSVPGIVMQAARFAPEGLPTSQLILKEKTATHTLMSYLSDDAEQVEAVSSFFAREGLSFEEQKAGNDRFVPGWSFSAVDCGDQTEVGLFAAVVMRLQCAWYQQRGQRDYCISQAALLAKRMTVENDITNSHEIVKRLFDFTVWEHELREFSANLKPWLKTVFSSLYGFWDMAEESAYVEKTLRHSHELLASGYQSRILVQERQQSRLLFVIATLGLLGIAGSLMSIWTALTWGGLVTSGFWISDTGNVLLIALVGANFLSICFVLYRFFSTQFD